MIKRKKRTRMVHRFISVRRREILSVQTNIISIMVVAKVSWLVAKVLWSGD